MNEVSWITPAQRAVQVHPGELATVVYDFQNVQDRRMAAQAVPSYAPRQAATRGVFNSKARGYSNQAMSAVSGKAG